MAWWRYLFVLTAFAVALAPVVGRHAPMRGLMDCCAPAMVAAEMPTFAAKHACCAMVAEEAAIPAKPDQHADDCGHQPGFCACIVVAAAALDWQDPLALPLAPPALHAFPEPMAPLIRIDHDIFEPPRSLHYQA